MNGEQLTFVELNKKIDEIPAHPSAQINFNAKEKWGVAIVAVAGGLLLLLRQLPPIYPWLVGPLLALLAIECIGVILLCANALKSLILRPSQERRSFAEQLDYDFPHYISLLAWLRSFPREQISAAADYARRRSDTLRARHPLLIGSLDKLGMLPLLAALFIQFHAMAQPQLPGIGGAILFVVLLLAYWTSLVSIQVRFRLDLYDALLTDALKGYADPNAGASLNRSQ